MLDTIGTNNGGQGLVRFSWRVVVINFDIVYLRAADNLLLQGCRYAGPCIEIMEIFLDDDIAAASEVAILIADQRRGWQIGTGRIGRSIDEAEQVARIEIPEARNFIDNRDGRAEACKQNTFELKAEIGPFGPDMKK